MLVKPTGVEGIPCVELRDHPYVDIPVHLKRFPEGPGWIGRHVGGHLSDLEEFLFPCRIVAVLSHLPCQLCVPQGVGDDGVTAYIHGLELLALCVGARVASEVQRIHGLLDVILEIKKAFFVDLPVEHRVSGSALLHELGEYTCLVAVYPLFGHLGKELVPHRPLFPVGNHDLGLSPTGFRVYPEEGFLPVIYDPEILERVAAKIRVRGRPLGTLAPLSDYEFTLSYVNCLSFHQRLERKGPKNRSRDFALVFLIHLGDNEGALNGKLRHGVQALFAKSLHSLSHCSSLRYLLFT